MIFDDLGIKIKNWDIKGKFLILLETFYAQI